MAWPLQSPEAGQETTAAIGSSTPTDASQGQAEDKLEDADVALQQLSSAVLVHDLPPAVPSFFSSAQLLPSADAEDEHADSDIFVRVRRIHRGSYVHRARFKQAILVHKLAAALESVSPRSGS